MAEKRMFSKKITDSDAFIEMSSSAQALYFHLNQGADDDGFNNQIRNAMFKAKASEDDLKVLLAKKFLIKFESGVIVIKHWRLHNTLRKDRYTPTNFQEELNSLCIKENGVYTQIDDGCQEVAGWLPDGCQTVTADKYSIDKNSIEEKSIDNKKNKKEKKSTEIDDLINSNFTDEELKNTVYEFLKMRKAIKKPLTTRGLELMIKKLYKITTNVNEQIEILNNSIMNNWQGIFPLKNEEKKNGMDDFKQMWEEAKKEDEQSRNNTGNNHIGW